MISQSLKYISGQYINMDGYPTAEDIKYICESNKLDSISQTHKMFDGVDVDIVLMSFAELETDGYLKHDGETYKVCRTT